MCSARTAFSEHVVKVDPRLQRPVNAEESVPEALVPDVVRTDVQQQTPDSPQTRWSRISRRAYELAQQRGFTPGAELSDWLQAEKEIDTAEQQKPENQNTG